MSLACFSPSDWSFETTRNQAEQLWEDELGKFELSGGTNAQQDNFYTDWYNTLLMPPLGGAPHGQFTEAFLVRTGSVFDFNLKDK